MHRDGKMYRRTIVKEELESAHLGEVRRLRVFMPPEYDETSSYPVVFCQDGEQFFNFGRIATFAGRLITERRIRPILIVGVDVVMEHRTADYAPEGARFDAYCRFFAEEMFPCILRKYPLEADAKSRVVAGDSLGGTVSLHLSMRYPELFGNVLSLSGALFESTRKHIEEQAALDWLRMYMLVGTDETEVVTDRGTFNFLEENRKTRKRLEEKQAALHYEEKKGAHIWGFWQQEIPHALEYFFGV